MKFPDVVLLAGVSAIVLACSAPVSEDTRSPQPGGSPAIVRVDSILLEERGDDYVAVATRLSVNPSTGDLVVSDAISSRLLRFDPTGTLDTVIGQKGSGPGEFKSPAAVLFLSGGAIAVSDLGRDALVLLDSNFTESGRSAMAGLAYSLASGGGDTILVGRMSRQPPYTSVLAVSTTTGEQRALVMAPPNYAAFPQMRVQHPYLSVVRTASHLVTGYSGSSILRDSVPGEPMSSFQLPAVHRRVFPENLAELFRNPIREEEVAGMASILTWVFPLTDDRIATVHMDYVLEGRHLAASGWVSIVDLQARRACVDAILPFGGLGKPQLASRGDTLFVLEHRATSQGDPVALVFKYALADTGCVWRDLESASEELIAQR